jgi:hypothetical protein
MTSIRQLFGVKSMEGRNTLAADENDYWAAIADLRRSVQMVAGNEAAA